MRLKKSDKEAILRNAQLNIKCVPKARKLFDETFDFILETIENSKHYKEFQNLVLTHKLFKKAHKVDSSGLVLENNSMLSFSI